MKIINWIVKPVGEILIGLSVAWTAICAYMYLIGHVKLFASAGNISLIAINTKLLP